MEYNSMTKLNKCILIIYVSIFLYLDNVKCLRLPEHTQSIFEEYVSVDVIDTERSRRSTTENKFPEQLTIDFKKTNDDVHLLITRNDKINVNVPIYHSTIDNIVEIQDLPNDEKGTIYQNLENGATFYVDFYDQSTFNIFGSFHIKDEEFYMEPMSIRNNTKNHRIFKTPIAIDIKGDYEIDPEVMKSIAAKKETSDLSRVKRATTDYNVELFIVVDYSIYKFWYDTASSSLTASEKDAFAKTSIRQFYAFVMSGIDVRYKSITSASFTISVVFAGLYISDSVATSTWTETIKVTSTSPNQVDASSGLSNFKTWDTSTSGLPDHDHAMLFTRYDLTKDSSTANAGLAYVSAMCGTSSQSIVEDHFSFSVLTVAAHELGHSLGASHDGDGNNACDGNDAFIMAASSSFPTGSTAQNPWKFSSCSVTYFQTLINNLNSGSNNCMTTLSANYNASALYPYDQKIPGQVYDADTQCEYINGAGSYMCRSFYNGNFTGICNILWCHKVGTTSCTGSVAGDGTLCGNNKWCISGACVESSNASSVSDTCPYGDQPGVIANGLTCAQLLSTSPWQCYNYAGQCCQSCSTIQTNITDCAYGDKTDCSALSAIDCYNNEAACCGTCASHKDTTIPGCEYGDKLNGCNANDCPGYSESIKAGCCKTCYVPPTTTTSATTTAMETTTTKAATTTTPETTTTKAATTTPETTTTEATTTTPETTTTEAATTTTALKTTTTETATTTALETTTTEATTTTTPETTTTETATTTALETTTTGAATTTVIETTTTEAATTTSETTTTEATTTTPETTTTETATTTLETTTTETATTTTPGTTTTEAATTTPETTTTEATTTTTQETTTTPETTTTEAATTTPETTTIEAATTTTPETTTTEAATTTTTTPETTTTKATTTTTTTTTTPEATTTEVATTTTEAATTTALETTTTEAATTTTTPEMTTTEAATTTPEKTTTDAATTKALETTTTEAATTTTTPETTTTEAETTATPETTTTEATTTTPETTATEATTTTPETTTIEAATTTTPVKTTTEAATTTAPETTTTEAASTTPETTTTEATTTTTPETTTTEAATTTQAATESTTSEASTTTTPEKTTTEAATRTSPKTTTTEAAKTTTPETTTTEAATTTALETTTTEAAATTTPDTTTTEAASTTPETTTTEAAKTTTTETSITEATTTTTQEATTTTPETTTTKATTTTTQETTTTRTTQAASETTTTETATTRQKTTTTEATTTTVPETITTKAATTTTPETTTTEATRSTKVDTETTTTEAATTTTTTTEAPTTTQSATQTSQAALETTTEVPTSETTTELLTTTANTGGNPNRNIQDLILITSAAGIGAIVFLIVIIAVGYLACRTKSDKSVSTFESMDDLTDTSKTYSNGSGRQPQNIHQLPLSDSISMSQNRLHGYDNMGFAHKWYPEYDSMTSYNWPDMSYGGYMHDYDLSRKPR